MAIGDFMGQSQTSVANRPTPSGNFIGRSSESLVPERKPDLTAWQQDQMLQQLSGEDRDAFAALQSLFASYGLASLAPKILEYVQQGYGADTITILLQQTSEYKQRFAANEARRKKGLPVLSPAEYLSVESSYRQLMRAAGLPPGFYDTPEDFNNLIAADVSPTEMQSRVNMANQQTNLADPFVKQALGQMGLSQGDLVAYYLDPNRALPILQKQAQVSQIGAAALRNKLDFDQQRAESWALQGITTDAAQQGFGAIAGFLTQAEKLATIYGQEYNQATAEAEVFGQSGAAQQQRKKLASQERGAFSGATGGARGGLASRGGAV